MSLNAIIENYTLRVAVHFSRTQTVDHILAEVLTNIVVAAAMLARVKNLRSLVARPKVSAPNITTTTACGRRRT